MYNGATVEGATVMMGATLVESATVKIGTTLVERATLKIGDWCTCRRCNSEYWHNTSGRHNTEDW